MISAVCDDNFCVALAWANTLAGFSSQWYFMVL